MTYYKIPAYLRGTPTVRKRHVLDLPGSQALLTSFQCVWSPFSTGHGLLSFRNSRLQRTKMSQPRQDW